MSGFDDNPFGEPVVDNPFADPAVQQVARNTTNAQNTLEDYNPFEQDNKSPIQAAVPSPVAAVQSTTINIPPSNRTVPQYSSNQISTEEFEKRREELDRKAAELDRREQEIQRSSIGQVNNWPPLPGKCFQPCFYQDINIEIPSEFQRIVQNLYYAWMFYSLTMCVNIIGGIIVAITTGVFTTFGLALLYAFIFTPTSYICWFRPAYKAFKSDSSFNFMIFFFVFFFQMILTIFQAVGIPGSGYCGFLLALGQFSKTPQGIICGILLLLIAIAFTVCAAADIMLLSKIHSIYRSSGASFAKAQDEFTKDFMRNERVQQAATSAMSSAVQSQLNNRY